MQRLALGNRYLRMGHADLAVEQFDLALPDLPEEKCQLCHIQKCRALRLASRQGEAIEYVKKLLNPLSGHELIL